MLEQQEKIKEKMVGNVLQTNLGVYDFFFLKTNKKPPRNKPVDFCWVLDQVLGKECEFRTL